MSLYRKLSRKPQLFLSVTGMNLHQFQTLLPQFTHAYDKLERRRKRKDVVTGKKRLRQIGGAAQFKNSLPDRLLMLLFYYRLYLTQEFMTLLFHAKDKSVICRAIQLMRRSLNWSCRCRNGHADGFLNWLTKNRSDEGSASRQSKSFAKHILN
jgi:hypothetical protein